MSSLKLRSDVITRKSIRLCANTQSAEKITIDFRDIFREFEELAGKSVNVQFVVMLEQYPGNTSLDHHDHFALAPAVEFAEKDSLPTPQQQLAVFERNRNAGADETGFDMRIRVFFAVAEAHAVLRD